MQTDTPLTVRSSTHTLVRPRFDAVHDFDRQTKQAYFAKSIAMSPRNFFGRFKINPIKFDPYSGIVSTISSPPPKYPGFEWPNGPFLRRPGHTPRELVYPTMYQ